MKKLLAVLLLATLVCLAGCSETVIPEDQYPIVTIELESGGIIKAVLYPNSAPNTVANFVTLIQSGFYDGSSFHRAVADFVVQGGSPDGTGAGNAGYYIKGEFIANGDTDNRLKHTRGMLSMARGEGYDTASCQFFICLDESSSLDGLYATFGMVTEGMEYIDAIAGLPSGENGILNENVGIRKMTVETFGVKYKVKKLRIQ